ncbi:MAG: hypothetical protein ACOCYT_01525 [Chloroflexota bacterium]
MDDAAASKSTSTRAPGASQGNVRPKYGLTAWQLTLGYISTHHSPDAALTLRAHPSAEGHVRWSGVVSWGAVDEIVDDTDSLADVLARLWEQVEQRVSVFENSDDAYRQPAGYAPTEWLDIPTQDVIHRLLWTTQTAFGSDWLLVIVYNPVEHPGMRVQVRLITRESGHRVGGRGPNLLDAARALFRHAAPAFADKLNLQDE